MLLGRFQGQLALLEDFLAFGICLLAVLLRLIRSFDKFLDLLEVRLQLFVLLAALLEGFLRLLGQLLRFLRGLADALLDLLDQLLDRVRPALAAVLGEE